MLEHPLPTSDENTPLMSENGGRSDKPDLSQLSSEHLSLIVDGDTLIKVCVCLCVRLYVKSVVVYSVQGVCVFV